MANNVTRVREYKLYLARHVGISLEQLGQMPALEFWATVREIEYQRRLEQYGIIYQLGQIMCILTNTKTARNKPEQFVGGEPMREDRRKMSKKETYDVLLGDGQTYTLAVLNANMMDAIEDEYDKSWSELFQNARMKVIKSMLLQMLKPKYPDIDMDKVGVLVNTNVLPALVAIITDMSK